MAKSPSFLQAHLARTITSILDQFLSRRPRDRSYEQDHLELLGAAADLFDALRCENEEDLSSLFCSELGAEAYQRLGLLSEEKPSNEYTPAHFSEKNGLQLLKGASLGEEITLKSN